MPTPNDNRSRVKDPLQPEFKHNQDNRGGQLDPKQHRSRNAEKQGGPAAAQPRQRTAPGKK